jgi:osmoprotectant transport system permease protein
VWAGIRTATVAVVATATLAAYVDSGGFGRYIVDGFRTGDDVKVFAGGLLVALLAVGLESLLALVQRRLVSPGLAASRAEARAGALADRRVAMRARG